MPVLYSRPFIGHRFRSLAALAVWPALLASSAASAAEFNIPAEKLDIALQQLARVSDLQIMYDPNAVAGRVSTPVAGTYSDREALAVMLSKSKLVADQHSAGGIIVIRQQVADASPTPVVSDTGSGAAKEESAELESVIVTAQKRREDLQHVPIAIKTIDAQTLDSLHVEDLKDASQLIPGLVYNGAAGQANPILRGLGVGSSGPWQEPVVSTYIDGVYYMNGNIANTALNNIARVEVDKGPQGTLFGRNALGGVIIIETKDPQHDPHADVSFGYANYNTYSGSFYGTTGITANLAADLALSGEYQKDGWGTNSYNGQPLHTGNRYSGRSKWIWTPGDNTKFTLIGDLGRDKSATAGFETARGVFPYVTTGPFHSGGFYDIYALEQPLAQLSLWGSSLKAEHDFGWAQFVSITADRHEVLALNPIQEANPPFEPQIPSQNQIPGNKLIAIAKVKDSTDTQEFQLLSPEASRFKWVVGTYFLCNRSGFLPNDFTLTSAAGPVRTIASTEESTHSYSGFAQATTPIFTDTWRLTGGIRYTSDWRSVEASVLKNTAANPGVFALVPSLGAGANPQPRDSWNKATYKAVIEHDFSDNVLTYVSYSTGFQSAFYVITQGANTAPTAPVTMNAYETGVKTNMFDNRVRFNGALFLYNLENMIVQRVINSVGVASNAASSRIKGLDFDLTARPIPDLTFTAGVQYVQPLYTNYPNAVAYVPNGKGEYASVPFDGAGSQLQYTERFMGTLSADYGIPTDIGRFALDGSLSYHSGTQFDVQGLTVQAPYALVNASLTWTAPSGRWDIKLWSQNLTNREYASLFSSNILMLYSVAPPRTYGIRFGFHSS